MIEFKRIKIEEKEELRQLENKVYNHLERKDFFMPFDNQTIDMMFDDDKIIAYGAYKKGNLIGTAQLYIDEIFVKDARALLNLEGKKIADLGGSLVLPEYRRNGIMTSLSTILIQEAKKRGFEYLIITIHPENTASNNTYLNLGAKKMVTTDMGEYLRNIYLLDLKKKKRCVRYVKKKI